MEVDLQLARPNNNNQELTSNGEFEIVNGENGMEIQPYTPPQQQQQNRGIPNPPSDENMGRFTINVPQTSVNNYTQPTITTNGNYPIPSGYTGFNGFTVNVTKPTCYKIRVLALDNGVNVEKYVMDLSSNTNFYNNATYQYFANDVYIRLDLDGSYNGRIEIKCPSNPGTTSNRYTCYYYSMSTGLLPGGKARVFQFLDENDNIIIENTLDLDEQDDINTLKYYNNIFNIPPLHNNLWVNSNQN